MMLEFEYKYRGIIVIPGDQFLFTGHFSKDSLYQFVAFMLCVMNKEISLFVQNLTHVKGNNTTECCTRVKILLHS